MPYFFLSYAPDEDDIFVRRFFRDLSIEVRQRVGTEHQQEVGYLDEVSRGSTHWPADARLALATCQTFVALCSAKYFLTSRCGRSWGIFADRMRDHYRCTGVQVPALVPVIWAGDGVPENAFTEDGLDITLHHTPDEQDLRVLMRLQNYRPAYRAFVSSLAHRVVETAHARRLPEAPPGTDIASATNVFEPRARLRQGGDRPQQVYFVVAAGTREQMLAVREDLQFYGIRREDWAPFQPNVSQPLAAHARGVAAGRLLESEVVPIEDLDEQLSASHRRTDIVVVLVDAWATRLETLRMALRALARQSDAEVAVLVPTSRDDPETRAHQNELRTAILGTFPERGRLGGVMLHIDIETMGTFDDDLATALAEAQHRIYRSKLSSRRSTTGQPGSRPILDGP